jgi:hypothetical protein
MRGKDSNREPALHQADALTVVTPCITEKSSKILNKFLDVVGYKLKDQIIQKSGLKRMEICLHLHNTKFALAGNCE